MNTIQTHKEVVDNYRSYLKSFLSIRDERIKEKVEKAFNSDGFLPEPLIQFNPEYEKSEPLKNLVNSGYVTEDLPRVFGDFKLYRHQYEAIEQGVKGKGFVVTSGTGSGKSLTYLATIFNRLLKDDSRQKGIRAILVYPMNALINSQKEEIDKYAINYLKSYLKDPESYDPGQKTLDNQISELEELTGKKFPITYLKYTGQESSEKREAARLNPPDIVLTNYMMLELIMTRQSENWMRQLLREQLEYLVFDELHTYRGRQGSDVSLLIRRIRGLSQKSITCIGTSATMITEGGLLERKMEVAKVAGQIFGDHYQPEQIIGEYLRYSTTGPNPDSETLKNNLKKPVDKDGTREDFLSHPLANWLERMVALKKQDNVLERATPKAISAISEELSNTADIDVEQAAKRLEELLNWVERLNDAAAKGRGSHSVLPFKFHQFISQTSVVSVTLESRESRRITIDSGRYIKEEDGKDVQVFPLLFSRNSGYDFICVEKSMEEGKLKPRDPDEPINTISKNDAKGKNLTEEDFSLGYIILDEGEKFWEDNFTEYLPSAWLNKDQTKPTEYYSWLLPQKIWFNKNGEYSHTDSESYELQGYYLPAKLRIDPTAGIIYEDVRTKENTKLIKLGNEGRSTATSIVSYSVLKAMAAQGVNMEHQKLLSFTDNRQDASLQAGHFNDFLATVRLRSALHQALMANTEGLEIHTIHERLFDHLNLSEASYANNPSLDPDFPEENNVRALKIYLLLRVLLDLKRGWRYTLPNLEQTGLLKIEYKNLERLAALPQKFEEAGLDFLTKINDEQRYSILYQFLNYFRTNFSLHHRYLDEERSETESFLKNILNSQSQWALDTNEHIEAPRHLRLRNPGRTPKGIYHGSIGTRSGIGKYLKRVVSESTGEILGSDELEEFIHSTCELLVSTGFLKKKEIKGRNTGDNMVSSYLLRTDKIIWLKGEEDKVSIDYVRTNVYRDFDQKPNYFFQNLYKTDFSLFDKELVGREHTGQLDSQSRIEREDSFRKGEISSLYCSPTMELGIDIAQLSVVHMRNVPPNPANYAQRSGRAGRSGQAALVFTYCSSYSSHDQNYFNNSASMVAGSVVPPRIDLQNQELIRSHLNAFLLMKMELGDLHTSVAPILDLSAKGRFPVKDSVKSRIEENIRQFGNEWAEEFTTLIPAIVPQLKEAWWYSDDWFKKEAAAFPHSFEKSFDRWRKLYKSARQAIDKARVIRDDPTIKQDSQDFKDAKRQEAVAEKQINLLKNDSRSSFGHQSEFYVFRYLASEGFVPGYNFTRLPVRTFVGYKYQDRGAYISRPRFVALREFGPHNTIYHDGNKYQMDRLIITDADQLQRKIKVSQQTGYAFFDNEAETVNNDPITHHELSGDNMRMHSKVLELAESEGVPQMRISCEEEERSRRGYEMEDFFNYPGGLESTEQAVIKNAGTPILNVIYGPATQLIKLNKKRRRSEDEGFDIDRRNGKWLRQKDLEDEDTYENTRRVKLFAQDTADTLYIQPLEALDIDEEQLISLAYALKKGLEIEFQVEEREVGVAVLGNGELPNILIYESAEGSLGLLSQLVSEPMKMKRWFTQTYRSMHFDPATRDETNLSKRLPKATYRDLLSYFNQWHHEILDRFSIKAALEYLMDCDVEKITGGNDREEHYRMLQKLIDPNSATEEKFLQYLYKNRLALPDKAQVRVPDYYVSADFLYNTSSGQVLIFCDGSPHDQDHVRDDDTSKREKLRRLGYDVVEWHYTEALEDLVQRRRDVFRKE